MGVRKYRLLYSIYYCIVSKSFRALADSLTSGTLTRSVHPYIFQIRIEILPTHFIQRWREKSSFSRGTVTLNTSATHNTEIFQNIHLLIHTHTAIMSEEGHMRVSQPLRCSKCLGSMSPDGTMVAHASVSTLVIRCATETIFDTSSDIQWDFQCLNFTTAHYKDAPTM